MGGQGGALTLIASTFGLEGRGREGGRGRRGGIGAVAAEKKDFMCAGEGGNDRIPVEC